jgi:hypothetical protein
METDLRDPQPPQTLATRPPLTIARTPAARPLPRRDNGRTLLAGHHTARPSYTERTQRNNRWVCATGSRVLAKMCLHLTLQAADLLVEVAMTAMSDRTVAA